MTPTESEVAARAAWDALKPETLNRAARRFRLNGHPEVTLRVLRNERYRTPDRFPQPVPIRGTGAPNAGLSVYSGRELDLWVKSDRDLRTMSLPYKALRAETLATVELVIPVQLTYAADILSPDDGPPITVGRLRKLRSNADDNGFPEPLDLDADHTGKLMVFSLPELIRWTDERKGLNDDEDAKAARAAAMSARARRSARTRAARAALVK